MTTINKQFNSTRRKTSVRLEPELLSALQEIADREKTTMSGWIQKAELKYPDRDLTSVVRVSILEYWRNVALDRAEAQS